MIVKHHKPEPEFTDFLFRNALSSLLRTPQSTHSKRTSSSKSPIRHKIKRPLITPLQHFHTKPIFSTTVTVPTYHDPDLSPPPQQLKPPSKHYRPATQNSQSGLNLSPKYINPVKQPSKTKNLPINFDNSIKAQQKVKQSSDKKILNQPLNHKKWNWKTKQKNKQNKNNLRIRNNITIYKGNFSSFSKKLSNNQRIIKMCHIALDNELSPWEIAQKGSPYR